MLAGKGRQDFKVYSVVLMYDSYINPELLFNGNKPILALKLHLVNPSKSIVFNLAVPSTLDFLSQMPYNMEVKHEIKCSTLIASNGINLLLLMPQISSYLSTQMKEYR